MIHIDKTASPKGLRFVSNRFAIGQTGSLILRIGLAFAFLYPAIDSFFNPFAWAGYFPPFLRDIAGDEALLLMWSLAEIAIALWLLSGWRIFIPSLLAVLSLAGIVVFNFSQMQVIFRDIALLAPALVLMLATVPPGLLQKYKRIISPKENS